jgi:hypothetical protein
VYIINFLLIVMCLSIFVVIGILLIIGMMCLFSEDNTAGGWGLIMLVGDAFLVTCLFQIFVWIEPWLRSHGLLGLS